MVGRGRPRHAHARGGAPVPERPGATSGGSLHWDVLGLHREVLAGLRLAAAGGRVDGIGIDSWAIDYGLLDAGEELLGNPYAYRDSRTDGVAAQVLNKVDARELYDRTGLQQLPFNTIYQLVAAAGTPALDGGDAAAAARPARLLADRRGRGRADQRLDHRPVRRARRASGPPSSPTGSASRRRSCRRCAPRATVVGPLLPEVAAARRPARRRPGHRGRLARHRLRGGRRAGRRRAARRTSPRAPGRWSGSSSTRRC